MNIIDAAARGAGDGLQLALNIGGMLIAFLALIAMVNGMLGWVHGMPGFGWLPGIDAGDFRSAFRADRLAAGRCMERLRNGRQPARHAAGAERIRGVSRTGPAEGPSGSTLVRDRDLCAVRLRESEFDRDSDRRHRSAGAVAQIGSGAPGSDARSRPGSMANFMSACIAGMLL